MSVTYPTKNGFPIVPAYAIDETHIWFKCPFHPTLTFHEHGSRGDLTDRLTHRGSHHQVSELTRGYYLDINPSTIRGTLKNKRVLKRSVAKLRLIQLKQEEQMST